MEREAGDLQRLEQLMDQERDALLRDRYRAVRLALRGKQAIDIADLLGICAGSRDFQAARPDAGRYAYQSVRRDLTQMHLAGVEPATFGSVVGIGILPKGLRITGFSAFYLLSPPKQS